MTILVKLFIRGVIGKVTTMTKKYHMTLNTISSVVIATMIPKTLATVIDFFFD